ncbi:MAG: RagB/SusD family nutrient uptake outer membrane protein [Bacteroidota bacterium]|nr:RagB/SusD family nutrient uptake outer membrane protein [Bacteroidota bacterium]
MNIKNNFYWLKLINIKLVYFILAVFFLLSCSDMLTEEPKSLAEETFYNTPAEVETAVNAIYSPLRNNNCLGGLYASQLESYTDYCYGNGSYAVLNDFQGLNATNINRVGSIWNNFYLAIRNANLVILNTPKGTAINEADINKFVGEAKFLRALTYFYLVRNWGGVPIRTENNMREYELKRGTIEEVYALILSDLQIAESNLPEKPSNIGRPSKWAAKTLLSDVYLQLNRFAEARDKAKEVIESQKYSLVKVSSTDDFQKIFGPDVINTTEEIFYLKFIRQVAQGYIWCMFVNDAGTKLHGAGGFTSHYSDQTSFFFTNWDDADLRKGNWFIWNINRGPNSLLSKKLIDPLAVSADGAGNDYTLYRYADLLLIYAESASRAAGKPTLEAMEALNQVHRRAYGKIPTEASNIDLKIDNYTAETFLDLVIKERGYEFQYESKRWLELKRTGKAAKIILEAKGKTIAPMHYLWPIPVSEMNYNKALDPAKDQNPGY